MGMAEIKQLRETTGAGILDCKKALTENDGDLQKAVDWLRTKGIAKAAKKAGRIASEGLVYSYIHAGGKIGVLVEVNCETDFVALNEDFKALCKQIAMHIAAAGPEYVRREEVPEAVLDAERAVQKARVIEEGKPAHIADKIVDGRMGKFFEERVLLEQKFVMDDKMTIDDLLTERMNRIGEKLSVRRFSRYVLGEGLEKRSDDFAAEVAAQINA